MQKKMVETIKAKDLFFLSPLGTLSLGRLVPATPWLRAPAARRRTGPQRGAAAAAPCLVCSYDTSLMLQNIKSSIFFFNSMGLGPHAELSMVA